MHSVTMLCRMLGVSPSGYYAWVKRPPSQRRRDDLLIGDRIVELHQESYGIYGRPRLHADLREKNIRISGKRLARLMRERGIVRVSRRKSTITTIRDKDARPAPDLVDRNFRTNAPDQLWVADTTYIPTWAGFLYLAVVLDAFSRKVVGWAIANHFRTELVLKAFGMAIHRRQPRNVIHHSDQDCQYTSIAFGKRCKEAGVRSVDRLAMRTTTRCARASMPRSGASCLHAIRSRRIAPQGSRSSTTSKDSTTRAVGILPSAISHPTASSAR
jgi:putative transposase